jgi:catechol 2,3-dioxygenase-like lactoylglutathione lyase family enzyme
MQVGYVTLGTNDLAKACAFYDGLMGSIEFSRIWDDGALTIWGKSLEEAAVGVTPPFDGGTASVGHGGHANAERRAGAGFLCQSYGTGSH